MAWFGITITGLSVAAVAGVLWPSIVATAATIVAAETASYLTRQAQWGGVSGLAIDVAAGGCWPGDWWSAFCIGARRWMQL